MFSKKSPKIALVHDYLNEFGGAERVLLALSELYPEAPIYTAFYKKGSKAWDRFKGKDVRVSWVHHVPFFSSKLHSPLRFLAPTIWNSFDFSQYDVILGSASWYITKGFKKRAQSGKNTKSGKTVEICYCHTPPRWLYGYPTSVAWQKYWPVRFYARIVGHFMRMYDYWAAQRVDQFVANSHNVAKRIEKFYRRDSKVIYPPVDDFPFNSKVHSGLSTENPEEGYYLITSRIVGGKGLDLAVKAAIKLGFRLKIAGKSAGYSQQYENLLELSKKGKVELLGYVSDEELIDLYSKAKAFFVLASDEDFGITPVEAMMTGTPVIAYRGGGYLETVVENKTGVFFNELSAISVAKAVKQFEKIKFDRKKIRKHAEKFSKERFQKEIKELVNSVL